MEWRPDMPGSVYVKVFLDDKEVKYCIYLQGASIPGEEISGEVAFFEVDKYGNFSLDEDFEPVRKSKFGMVRWEWTGEESYAEYAARV